MSADDAEPRVPRQRVVRTGRRRVSLTPAPGTHPEPASADDDADATASGSSSESGPNDARMRQDVPPHY
ncbi:hypothetical protein ACFQZV_06485 [Microbacterium koreense]|uniref:Uncharacterized protein n=1 Tax=Microbacterium koreense TaxID=323761 RepID=A0ABW2ZQX3_9MICO